MDKGFKLTPHMLNIGKLLNRLKWSTFKAEGRWDVDDQGLTPHRTFLLLA